MTMYDASDKMLVDNEISRYKIRPDTKGLNVAADGSITIPFPTKNRRERTQQTGYRHAKAVLRDVAPVSTTEDVLSGKWQAPQLEKVQ